MHGAGNETTRMDMYKLRDDAFTLHSLHGKISCMGSLKKMSPAFVETHCK